MVTRGEREEGRGNIGLWHMIFLLVVCSIRKIVVPVEADFSVSNLLTDFDL